MSRYVDPTEQLVTEIVVKDIKRSIDFYRRLGFDLARDGGDFRAEQNQTVITTKHPKETTALPGLVLVRFASAQGQLVIEHN